MTNAAPAGNPESATNSSVAAPSTDAAPAGSPEAATNSSPAAPSTNAAPAGNPEATANSSPVAASTNAESSSSLQLPPEQTEPATTDRSSLSLHPESSTSTAPPEVIAPDAGMFPDTLHAPNLFDDTDDLAAHLLVVYNSADADSRSLAQYYAAQRNIPTERVLGVLCPLSEEITRTQFDDSIRTPIISYLTAKDWMARESQRMRVGNNVLDLLVATRNDIWAIVLMRGMPLKIAPDPNDTDGMESQPALQTNAAAVDSELALLPVFGLPKGGFVPNIFFDDQVSGIKRIGPDLARNMVLVTRLDGPTVADVRRMIDDTLYAEQHRLAGLAVIDSRGLTDEKNGYTCGDDWLRRSRDMLDADGWDVKFDDKPDVLPVTDPCNQVAIYLGWYHDTAVGPWVTAPDRFVRGAIAYHLHSFSAATVRSPTSNWVGPLIAHGAAATMGTVYEPYLALTPHEDIFTRRILQGDYFAEAAYAAEPGLSWMTTVVGDPLYRPFRQSIDSALAESATPHTGHDDWLLLQKVQQEILAGQIQDNADSLKLALDVPGAGPVAEEGLGDLLLKINDPATEAAAGDAAVDAYQKALDGGAVSIDYIRVGLKLAQIYAEHRQRVRQQGEYYYLWSHFPDDAVRFEVPKPVVPNLLLPVNNATGGR